MKNQNANGPIRTGDETTDRFANFSAAGQKLTSTIKSLIERDDVVRIEQHFSRIVDDLYDHLPSGDYGRGDVKRVLRCIVDASRLSTTDEDGRPIMSAEERQADDDFRSSQIEY